MSIQQAMNNMLFSAQVGAGLYAQSPAAKAQAEYNKAEKEFQKTESVYSQWAEPTNEDEEKIYEQMSQRQADLASKMYSIKSTQENYEKYKETLGGLVEKIEGKTAQKNAFKERKERLGTPGMTGIEEYLKGGKK